MIFDFHSSRDYLQHVLASKKKVNEKFSLRGFSKLTGVSVSALSGFFSQKKNLSVESAMRIAIFLRLDAAETDYLVTLIQLESAGSEKVKASLKERLQELASGTDTDISQRIVSLRENSEVYSSYQYRLADSLASRTLIRWKCKQTDQVLPFFCDHFVSPERLVGSNSYFLPNPDKTYSAYFVKIHEGKVVPTLLCEDDLRLKVDFDEQGFPLIRNLHMKTLGTTYYSVVDLIFSRDSVIQAGYRYNKEIPGFKEKLRREWVRVL